MPTLVFDCETVPDARVYRTLLDAPSSTALTELVNTWTEAERPFKPGLQQVISLAVAWIADDGTFQRLTTLGPDEAAAITTFFDTIAQYHPVLVGWNSSGFDVPVLLARALVHQIPVGDFYTVGKPYDGYLKRYSEKHHRDLMDLQSSYGATARLRLDEMAVLLGLPGKLDTHGDDVLRLYTGGELARIHAYCQHDVMTTAWIYARMAVHHGWWSAEQGAQFDQSARAWLARAETHWDGWRTALATEG